MHIPRPLAEPHPAAARAPALQQLDYTSLRAVLAELDPVIVPSRFEKAQQSETHTLQLGLRGLQGTQWLELSWLAEAPRLLAIPPPPRQGDGSTLAQQLQHGLRGLALVELHQPAWERVVELRFATRPGAVVERTLVLELMGRHSNLFLLDPERRVIALARQVRDRQSRLRPIATGDPYQSPPGQAGERPRREESDAAWRQRLSLLPLPLGKALLSAYQGTSPALVRQLLEDPFAELPRADGADLRLAPPETGAAERGAAGTAAAGHASASLPVADLSEAQWLALWSRWQAWLAALAEGRFALQWLAGGGYRCWSEPHGDAWPWGAEAPAAAGLPGAAAEAAAAAAAAAPGSADLVPGAGAVAVREHTAVTAPPEAGGAGEGDRPPTGAAAPAADALALQQGSPEALAMAAAAGVSRSGATRVAEQAGGAPAGAGRPPLAPAGSRTTGAVPGGAGPASAQRSEALAINRALAAHYGRVLAGRRTLQRRQSLEARLRAALEREQSQLEHQEALLAAVPEADALQRQADGLLCLPDPNRQTIDEAQSLYRRARKLRRSVAAITPRIALHRQRLAGLETSLTFLEQLEALEPREGEVALAALEEELLEQLERLRPGTPAERQSGRGRARRRDANRADPQPLELCGPGGLRLQVGRNHRQNEWISLRQARRGDLWFHAQEQPGSHVVLKGSEAPPGEADLQAAADLAAHFSRGRGNRRVPVLMVPAETLQRIPGAEPGTVRHRGGEVLWGEPERAQALLQAGADGAASC